MADFVESAKNFMNSAVSRTGWEAQKQMRVRSKQGEIDELLKQREQILNELSNVALNLYQQGSLTDAQLSRLCASILELDNDVRRREMQLQEVKQEAYSSDQYGPAPTTNYAPPPINPNPPGTAPSASHQSAPPVNPQPGQGYMPPAQPAPGQSPSICPTCSQPVRSNSLYCRNCGTKLR